MKKLFAISVGSLVLCGALNATSLNQDSIKIGFEGYKTPSMAGTMGSFSKATFKFNKDESSLTKQLKGASVVLSPKNIDMGGEVNQLITDNVVKVFFENLNKQGDIKVDFINVIEGELRGTISAKITIGKESTLVPLSYEILGNNDFVAKGRLDLSAFSNSAKALKALSDVAAGHAGISWNIVDITVNAKLK